MSHPQPQPTQQQQQQQEQRSPQQRQQGQDRPAPSRVGQVPPSALNEGDRGAADVPPTTSEQLNFDDASEDHPRGTTRRTGGTWNTPDHNTGDQGAVGPAPGAGLSDRNGPSDPDAKNAPPMP